MNFKKNACFLPNRNTHLFKYILFFVFIFSVTAVSAQTMTISAPDFNGTEGPLNDDVTFRVRKSPGGLFLTYTVPYTITVGAGNAINGTDYTMLSGFVTIPNGIGVTTVDILVDFIEDDIVEGTENITITLDPPLAGAGYFVGAADTASATVDDDDVGIVTLDVLSAAFIPEVVENGSDLPTPEFGQFRPVIDKANGTTANLTVDYTITGSATGTDYTLTNAVNLVFANNGISTARNIRVAPIDDVVAEIDETVIITLTGTDNPLYTIGSPATATITILDDDCPAGANAPVLNGNSTDFCDVAGVDLNSFYDGAVPAGAPLRWSTVANPTVVGDLLPVATASNAPADTYFAVFWSNAQACASPSSPPLTITINQSPEAGTADTGLFSCNDQDNGDTEFDLDDAINGADPGGVWSYVSGPVGSFVVPGDGEINFENRPSGSYVFQYTIAGEGACPNDTADVSISVSDCDPCIAGNVAPELDITIPTVFCDAVIVNLDDYTTSTPPAGTVLRWSLTEPTDDDVPAAISPNVTQRGTYFGYFYDATNDCASPALRVIITENTTPMITNSTGGTRCGPGPVTFSATATGNATFNWYTSEMGGAVAGTGANFTPDLLQTTIYYLEATENGCATSPRVPVTGTVQVQPSAGIAAMGASSCNNSTFGTTTLDLDDLLTGADVGGWVFTSGPIDVPFDSENIVDFNTRPDGDYVYTFSTTGAQIPCTNESVAISISVSSCDTDADGDGLLGGVEAALGTDPNDVDSDNDLINDDVEVGADIDNPLDQDEDGIIDALDSNLADSDSDGVVDQLDPANNNACIPDNTNALCDEPIDLEVLKVIDNPNAVVGDEIVFTVTVNNLGSRAAKTIVIGDFLESGFEYKSHIPSSGTYDQDSGQWQLTDLAPDASATLSITVTVVADENEMYSNTAELLSSDPLDSNQANDSSTVTLGVEQPEGVNLILEKTARLGPDTQRLQELTGLVNDIDNTLTVEYFIKVVNKSQEGAASNISIRDQFEIDSDIIYEIMEPVNPPQGSTFNTSTGIWNISRSLGVDEEIELSYTVVFEGTGTVVNTAQINSPQNTDAESADSTTSSVTVEITTRNELEIGILYNQFSPNSDGINDVLKVNRLRKNALGFDELVVINYSIEIYNRYGGLVYEAAGLTEEEAWDGTWKGKQVPDGTYFYGLNVSIEGEEGIKTSKGWIQLIR